MWTQANRLRACVLLLCGTRHSLRLSLSEEETQFCEKRQFFHYAIHRAAHFTYWAERDISFNTFICIWKSKNTSWISSPLAAESSSQGAESFLDRFGLITSVIFLESRDSRIRLLKMEVTGYSETSMNIYQTTLLYIREDTIYLIRVLSNFLKMTGHISRNFIPSESKNRLGKILQYFSSTDTFV
jgi:hypothetical protein